MLISEYTGGGFGSKVTGAITLIIPAILSSKLNAPVMMRISREEEHYIGRARPSVLGRHEGRVREGRANHGARYVTVCNTGAYDNQGDGASSGRIVSLLYQPPAMRWRGISVMTNTPTRSAQSSPGGMQGITIIEPILAKAARKLGVDQVALRRVNCPEGQSGIRPAESWKAGPRHQLLLKTGAGQGAEQFKWQERLRGPSAWAPRCAAWAFR